MPMLLWSRDVLTGVVTTGDGGSNGLAGTSSMALRAANSASDTRPMPRTSGDDVDADDDAEADGKAADR